MTTTIDKQYTRDYIDYVDVKFSNNYNIKVHSYRFYGGGITITNINEPPVKCLDYEDTFYAYNMIPDFEFRNFTGKVYVKESRN